MDVVAHLTQVWVLDKNYKVLVRDNLYFKYFVIFVVHLCICYHLLLNLKIPKNEEKS